MIDNVIWSEVFYLKFYERYLNLYLDLLKNRRKWVHVLSLAFSSGGLLSSVQWDIAPLIGISITAAIQIFSILQEHVIMSQADLSRVIDLRILCIYAFNKFEKLYLKYRCNKMTEDESIDEFYAIRQEFIDIHKLFNALHLPPRKKLGKKAAMDSIVYLRDYFKLTDSVVSEAAAAVRL